MNDDTENKGITTEQAEADFSAPSSQAEAPKLARPSSEGPMNHPSGSGKTFLALAVVAGIGFAGYFGWSNITRQIQMANDTVHVAQDTVTNIEEVAPVAYEAVKEDAGVFVEETLPGLLNEIAPGEVTEASDEVAPNEITEDVAEEVDTPEGTEVFSSGGEVFGPAQNQ